MKRVLLSILLACGLVVGLSGGSLPDLKYRALSSTGKPLSGAKLYFYKTGTTTALATYSDAALSSANANPVVSDAYGWFGEIYLKTTEAYRVKLTTSAGVVQWTLDGIWAAQLASNSFQTRLKQAASNPLDYGAVGDGVADESTYVQSAITAATNTVDLLGKTYRCDSTITLKSGISLRNGTLDFTHNANNSYITATGTVGSAILLTGDVGVGATNVTPASVTSLAVDDWIYIESSEQWMTGNVATSGEIFQIVAIDSGDVYLDHPTLLSYEFAVAAGVFEITPVDGVELFDLSIEASSVASGTGNIIVGTNVTNMKIRDVTVDGPKGSVVLLSNAAKVAVSNLTVTGGANATSYGMRIRDAAWMVSIADSRLSTLEYGVDVDIDTTGNDGLVIGLDVLNTRFDDIDQPIYIAPHAYDVDVIGNTITSSETAMPGMSLRSGLMVIKDNFIQDVADEGMEVFYALGDDMDWNAITITGNTIYDAGDEGIYVKQTSSGTSVLDELFVEDNVVYSPGGNGLRINTHLSDRVTCSGNEITNSVSEAILFVGLTGSSTGIEVDISDNRISMDATAQYGISIVNAYGGYYMPLIANNRISGAFRYGIYLGGGGAVASVNGARVIGNDVAGDGAASLLSGIRLSNIDGPDIIVRDNRVTSADKASAQGIYIDQSTDVTTTPAISVIGNRIDGDYVGLEIELTSEASTQTTITDNDITADNGIILDATTASSDILVNGNTITGTTGATTYTMQITGAASNVAITGNNFNRGDDLAHNILLSGSGAAAITIVNITGNVFTNGDYAIGEGTDANSTEISLFSNHFVGLSTDSSEYTVFRGLNYPSTTSVYGFYAYLTTDQTVTGVETIINHAEKYDYGSWHDTTTGIATIPVEGMYVFSFYVEVTGADAPPAGDNVDIILTSSGVTGGTVRRFTYMLDTAGSSWARDVIIFGPVWCAAGATITPMMDENLTAATVEVTSAHFTGSRIPDTQY